MRQIGPGIFSTRVVFSMLGIALLLTLACGASVPAAQVDVSSGPSSEPVAVSEAAPESTKSVTYATFEPYVPREKPTPTPGFTDSGNKVGDQIPDFTITLVDGTKVTSVELVEQRQPTFLFFFESWCPICQRELQLMKDVYPEFADEVDLYVIGATPVDSLENLEELRLERGYIWPMADAEGSLLRDLNVAIRSTKIAFNADGIITYRATYGQADQDTWREVFAELVASKS